MRIVSKDDRTIEGCTNQNDVQFGANIVELYDENGEARRSLYLVNDGSDWKYGQLGEPLEFERQLEGFGQLEFGGFTRDSLVRYVEQLGVRPFCESWYASDVVKCEIQGNLPTTLKEHF